MLIVAYIYEGELIVTYIYEGEFLKKFFSKAIFFLQMQTLLCLGLVYSKNYFNLTRIYVLRLFKMPANQTKGSDLNGDVSLNVS